MRRDQDTGSREGTEVLGLGDRVLTREPWTGWMWEVRKRLEHLGAVPGMERPGRGTEEVLMTFGSTCLSGGVMWAAGCESRTRQEGVGSNFVVEEIFWSPGQSSPNPCNFSK